MGKIFWQLAAGIAALGWTCAIAQEVESEASSVAAEAELGDELELADDLDALLDMVDRDFEGLSEVSVAVGNSFSASSADDVAGAGRQVVAEATSANIVSGLEAAVRNTTDAGSLLSNSVRNPGVFAQRRSPIVADPRIRGYRFGQFLARADGAFWYPARLDLDAITSKIDSWIIDDVVVVKGPYSSRYGPGFSFIDIATRSTPRSLDGSNLRGSTGVNYNGNGQQWNAHQYFERAEDDWGALVYYSHLTGADYLDGNRNSVPSSYQSRNFNAAIGFDWFDQTAVEFRYLRQDQTDVELPGQFTDIDFLVTDGFSANLTSENHRFFDLLTVDGWYNRTRAAGSGGRAPKQELFNNVFDAPAPFGGLTLPRDSATDFDVTSTGFSLAATWGLPGARQTTIGADLRVHRRGLNESQFRPAGTGGFRSGTEEVVALIPKSESTNPGVFAELDVPINEQLDVRAGGRVDWVSVSAGPGVIVRRGGPRTLDVLGPDRESSYTLWSAFLTGDYRLTDVLTLTAGFGLAQRPPSLTELYAMRPFESVVQQGLNRIQGYPFLLPERLKQLDVGLRAENGYFRGGINGFYSWIDNYITYQGLSNDPTSTSGRPTTVFVNTPEATLAGGEAFGECDLNECTTLFGSVMYVEGRNQTLNALLFGTASLPAPPGSRQGAFFGRGLFDQSLGQEPLPQIPPLESRVGIRWNEPCPDPAWTIELSARIVDNQDRVAAGSLLEQATPGFTTFDLRGVWRPFEDLSLVFGILNFTDKHYREHLDNRAGNQLFQPGITGYVGSELTY